MLVSGGLAKATSPCSVVTKTASPIGTGTLAGTIDGVALTVLQVGGTAGLDPGTTPPEPAPAQLAQVALLPGGTAELVLFQLAPAQVRPGTVAVGLDAGQAVGVVYHYTPPDRFELVGLMSEGSLALSAAATTDGAAIDASFTGTVIRNPF